jgi:hypothetical protein
MADVGDGDVAGAFGQLGSDAGEQAGQDAAVDSGGRF